MDRVFNRPVLQTSWIADDIENLARKWARELQVGPFYVLEVEFNNYIYRGEPSECRVLAALAQADNMQIELIQPLTDAPNPYRDSVRPGEIGFHHIAVWTEDVQAEIEHFNQMGYETAHRGDIGFAEFAYLDTRPLLDCMLEVLEKTPTVSTIFGNVAAACREWDGSDPWRPLPESFLA